MNDHVILRAMTRCRRYGSETEIAFIHWLTERVGGYEDKVMNVHRIVRKPDGSLSRTLFSSHTDSVHRQGGKNKIVTTATHWTATPKSGRALGADDATGIALMVHMIDNNIPGHYIFHRGEEVGGIGSKWLADKHAEWLSKEFDRAIAFDRAGYSDVITYQGGDRCCSDKFAEALADQLNEHGGLYMPDDGGVYTDTREYIELIPECTNLSVGYNHQHGDSEKQDIAYFHQLADIVLKVKWDELPTARDPKEYDCLWGTGKWGPMVLSAGLAAANDDAAVLAMNYASEVGDALDQAYGGDCRALAALAAEWAYPENPTMVERRISSKRLTIEVLDDMYTQLLDEDDPDGVLASVVDIAYID